MFTVDDYFSTVQLNDGVTRTVTSDFGGTGTINAAGQLSFSIGTPSNLLRVENVFGAFRESFYNFTVSNTNVRIAMIQALRAGTHGQLKRERFVVSDRAYETAWYVYVDSNVTITGGGRTSNWSNEDGDSAVTTTRPLNLALQRGWNALLFRQEFQELNEDDPPYNFIRDTVTITVANPGNLQWILYEWNDGNNGGYPPPPCECGTCDECDPPPPPCECSTCDECDPPPPPPPPLVIHNPQVTLHRTNYSITFNDGREITLGPDFAGITHTFPTNLYYFEYNFRSFDYVSIFFNAKNFDDDDTTQMSLILKDGVDYGFWNRDLEGSNFGNQWPNVDAGENIITRETSLFNAFPHGIGLQLNPYGEGNSATWLIQITAIAFHNEGEHFSLP